MGRDHEFALMNTNGIFLLVRIRVNSWVSFFLVIVGAAVVVAAKEVGVKNSLDDEVVAMLAERGVEAVRLSGGEHRDWESGWRAVYGHLFESGSGWLAGGAAVGAYRR